jgi:hypothetical protein
VPRDRTERSHVSGGTMASREWFAAQLDSLGLGCLDGVFEYVESMPAAEVPAYMESLTGTGPEAVAFVAAYAAMRSTPSPTTDAAPASFAAVPNMGGGGKQAARKRGRGRGRGRAAASGTRAAQSLPETAAAVAPPPAQPSRSPMDSAVERSRALVHEYRRTKKVVNCLSCGFIERALGEGGACSFCGSPMFPIGGEESGSSPEGSSGERGGLEVGADAATAHKDKLLSFDRTSARRTEVHDDDAGHVDADTDNWLTAEERQAACAVRDAAVEERNRRSFVVTIDLAGRRVLSDADRLREEAAVETRGGREAASASASAPGAAPRPGEVELADDRPSTAVDGRRTRSGSTGEFVNPVLSGPVPRFTVPDGSEGAEWLAAVTASAGPAGPAGPAATGRMQREVGTI